MGAAASTKQAVKKRASPTYFDDDDLVEFEHLGLGRREVLELAKIYTTYKPTLDYSSLSQGSKKLLTVGLNHLLLCWGLTKSIMTIKLFDVKSIDNDARISFRSFVIYLWRFLTMKATDLLEFSFHVYNLSGDSKLTSKELQKAISRLYQNDMRAQQALIAVAEPLMDIIDERPGQVIGKEDYVEIVGRSSHLFAPLVDAQRRMRDEVLGTEFWRHHEEKASDVRRTLEVDIMLTTECATMNAGHKAVEDMHLCNAEEQYAQAMDPNRRRSSKGRNMSQSELLKQESNNNLFNTLCPSSKERRETIQLVNSIYSCDSDS
jgi:hypothetical protein